MKKKKLRDLHYELLEHPPYSPDLAPSDFCLFPKLKLFLAGQRFFLESRGDSSC
jgi:histone-lysine N-methyltransferase SETMAR